MARKLVANQDNTSTSSQTEPLTREVARPIFGENVLAIDYNFAEKEILDDDITFSRASGATQTNSEGKVAFAPHNLLAYSEDIENNWNKYSFGGASRTFDDSQTDPFGGTDATKILATNADTSSGGTLLTREFTTHYGAHYILSVYLKGQVGGETVQIDFKNQGSSGISGSSVTLTTEWQRFSALFTSDHSGTRGLQLRLLGSASNQNFYFFGAQAEQTFDSSATTPSAYYKTSGTAYNSPRFDYDHAASLSTDITESNKKGLLIEEARTNLQPNSSLWVVATHAINNFNAIENNFAISPTGARDAWRGECYDTGGAARHEFYTRYNKANATQYTHSLYIKPFGTVTHLKGSDEGSSSRAACFDLVNCQVVSNGLSNQGATIEKVTEDGWVRVSITFTSVAANTDSYLYWAVGDEASLVSANSVFANYNPGKGSGVYCWGVQQEVGGFPTSLIPTYGATADRAADVATISGTNFSRFFKDTEGTIVLDVQLPRGWSSPNYNRLYAFTNDGVGNNRIESWIAGNNFKVYADVVSPSSEAKKASDTLLTSGEIARIAQVYKTNFNKAYQDGEQGDTDTTVTLPTGVNRLNIAGLHGALSATLGGWIRRLRYFNKKKSDTQVQKLTDTSFLLDKFKGAKAAHSLRSLRDGRDNSPVTRIRREYDSYEADYTAAQVSNGELENDFKSEKQTTLPLDVSVEADEMVTGGDFTDIVTNGTFDSDSGWTKASGATIGSGVATIAITGGGYTYITQSLTYVAGRQYTVTVTLNGTSGKQVRLRDNTSNTGGLTTTNGLVTLTGSSQTVDLTWTATSTSDKIAIERHTGDGDWSFTVDNVSVVEGGWTLDSGFSFGSGTLNRAAANAGFAQVASMPVKVGKTYDIKFDIVNHSTGTNYLTFGGDYLTKTQTANGSYSYRITATSATKLGFYAATNAVYSIDNVSVKEVNPIATGFSTRKINSSYTGKAMRCRNQGNVEVEVGFDDNDEISLSSPVTNTSQNLLAYSEDFTSWTNYNAGTVTSGQADPFGGNNAHKISSPNASTYNAVLLNTAKSTSELVHTLSFYQKKEAHPNHSGFSLFYSGVSNSIGYYVVDPLAGTCVLSSSSTAGVSSIINVESHNDDWWRISVTQRDTGANNNISVYMYPGFSSNGTTPAPQIGDMTIHAAQLEETQYESTGTEKITDGGFDNGLASWVAGGDSSLVSVENGAIRINSPDSVFTQIYQDSPVTAGKKYVITADLTVTSGGVAIGATQNAAGTEVTYTSSGSISQTFVATSTSSGSSYYIKRSGAANVLVDNVSVLEYDPELQTYAQTPVISDDGSNTTATTLGEFSGKENLLPYSNEFTNSAWSNYANMTANRAISPTGENNASEITTQSAIYDSVGSVGGNITVSIHAKKNTATHFCLSGGYPTSKRVVFDLETGVACQVIGGATHTSESLPNGWWRFSVTVPSSSTDYIQFSGRSSCTYAADNRVAGVYVYGAQINTGSTLKPYQETTGTALTGDVHVVNWYSQSGSEDFTQSTAGEQPRIVMGSELVTDSGGKASVYFDGGDTLDNNTLAGQNRLDSYTIQDTSDSTYVIPSSATSGSHYGIYANNDTSTSAGSHAGSASFGTPNVYKNGAVFSTSTLNDVHDGLTGKSNLLTMEGASTSVWTSFTVGHYFNNSAPSFNFTGKISEMVFFGNMDSSPKRFNIEQNMLNHFDVNLAQANFETNVNGLGPSNALGATATITHETTDPLTGSGSAKVSISGAVGATSYPRLYGNNVGADNLFLPVNPVVGEKYKITMTTKVISGTVQMIGIGFGDQGGNGSAGEVSGEDITFSGTQTHVFEKTLTSVAGSNTNRLYFAFNGTHTGVFLIDSIKIEKTGVRGFVTTLYDQTGNNCHALQSTAAYQPQIVNGGDLIKSGGHPAWEFKNNDPYHVMHLHGKLKAAHLDAWFVHDTSDPIFSYPNNYLDGSDFGWVAQDGSSSTSNTSDYGGGNAKLYVNGDLIGTSGSKTRDEIHTALSGRKLVHHQDSDTADWNKVMMGWYGEGTAQGAHIPYGFTGKFSEWIWYDSDQSSNRTSIDTAINTHYNIY